jgi:hypothetical protein
VWLDHQTRQPRGPRLATITTRAVGVLTPSITTRVQRINLLSRKTKTFQKDVSPTKEARGHEPAACHARLGDVQIDSMPDSTPQGGTWPKPLPKQPPLEKSPAEMSRPHTSLRGACAPRRSTRGTVFMADAVLPHPRGRQETAGALSPMDLLR